MPAAVLDGQHAVMATNRQFQTQFRLSAEQVTGEVFLEIEQGLFDYPERSGPEGVWAFGPGDRTPRLDYREVYWDPNEMSPFNNEQGAYIDPNPGERYRPGGAPPGDPRTAD
jgi:hypothetical protein